MTPAARREAVVRARAAFELSERRACAALGFDRSSARYRGGRADDAELRGRLRDLSGRGDVLREVHRRVVTERDEQLAEGARDVVDEAAWARARRVMA